MAGGEASPRIARKTAQSLRGRVFGVASRCQARWVARRSLAVRLRLLGRVGPLLGSVLSLGPVACNVTPAPFVCSASDQCTGGTCERTGYCSFPNPDCESGREYGRYSAPELAHTCVPASVRSESGEGSGDATTAPNEASSTTGSSTGGMGTATEDSTSDEGSDVASETATTTRSESTAGGTSDSEGTDDGGTHRGDASGLAESSSTGAPASECFHDAFDGEGRDFEPFWSLEGEFPGRVRLSGTGQLEFDINTGQAGASVLLATLDPSAPAHAVDMELGAVNMSSGGREQLVLALGVRQTVGGETQDALLQFQLSEAQLRARITDESGSMPVTLRSVTYWPAELRYLRLRTSGLQAAPSYHWETSLDGYSWSNFYCLSQTRLGCEWPEDGFPLDEGFAPGTPIILLSAGAFDVSSPPYPDAFRVETLNYCPFY